MSSFRAGLVIGGAIGYVLGAKAGRQRYEQIRSAFQTLTRSQPAQQLGAEVRDLANRAGQRIEDKAAEGVSRITEKVRRDAGNGHTTAATPPAPLPPT